MSVKGEVVKNKMSDCRFGMIEREQTEYGPINGPYVRFIGKYVRVIRGNGCTHVGKVVHADGDGILLLPCVVNVGTRDVDRMALNSAPGLETFVSSEGCAIESLFLDDQLGRAYLEQIVAAVEKKVRSAI